MPMLHGKPTKENSKGEIYSFTGAFLKSGINTVGDLLTIFDKDAIAKLYDVIPNAVSVFDIESANKKIDDVSGGSHIPYEILCPDATDEARKLALKYGVTITTPREPRFL